MKDCLVLEHVGLTYGEYHVLNDVDACFRPGEVAVITGTSGSGKSSLLKLINGVVPEVTPGEVSGTVRIGERVLTGTGVEARSDCVSTVFQNPKTQFYALNTTDEIAFAMENRNLPRDEILERMNRYTTLLETRHLLNREIFNLSGGEKQMVAMTGVACMEAGVYLLDEPSSSLDPESIERLANAVRVLKELGKIVIVAEHRLYYLRELMDVMYVLEDGHLHRIDAEDVTEETRERFRLRSLERVKSEDLRDRTYRKVSLFDPEAPAEGILSCEGFRFHYRYGPTVFDFNIGFPDGCISFLIGKNGIGKSTFLRNLCRLHRRSTGKSRFSGERIRKPSKYISAVMQEVNYQLFAESVEEEVRTVCRDDRRIEEALRAMNLWDMRERHPQGLSGGEKQRLLIAVALASDCPIVLLDEPTSGLCRSNMERLRNMLTELRDAGKKVIVVTHDMELIRDCPGEVVELVRE